MPHFLNEAQKQDRVDYCQKMLEKFDGGRSKRVYDVITGDESWFYYYDPEMKRQNQVWIGRNDPHPTKVRRQRSAGKHLFAIFFMEYLETQSVKLMGHPAYSPDLSPCDFWLFLKIKEQLRGKDFQDFSELQGALEEQMNSLQKEDFYQCFEQWFERMNKCIRVQESTLKNYNKIILN